MGEFDLLFFDMYILFYEKENRYKDQGRAREVVVLLLLVFFPILRCLKILRNICWVSIGFVEF